MKYDEQQSIYNEKPTFNWACTTRTTRKSLFLPDIYDNLPLSRFMLCLLLLSGSAGAVHLFFWPIHFPPLIVFLFIFGFEFSFSFVFALLFVYLFLAERGRYICFWPILFSLSSLSKVLYELLIYPTKADKNRWVVLLGFFERTFSILYSWGRQTQINSWSGEKKGTKHDKNGAANNAEGGSYDGEQKVSNSMNWVSKS